MADGSIRISTKIDNADAEKSLKRLYKSTQKTVKQIKAAGEGTALNINIQQAEDELERVQKKVKELQNGFEFAKAISGERGYKTLTDADINAYVDRINEAKQKEAELKEYVSQLKEEQIRVTEAAREQAEATAKSELRTSALRRGFSRCLNSVNSIGKSIAGKITNGIKKAGSKMKELIKGSDKFGKKILRAGLALVGMRSIMAGFRQMISSAMNDNEKLQKQLTAVKGVLGTGLAPVINMLVSGLSQIVTFADKLYQLITGVSLIAKYNANQSAKLADNTASAAESAAKYKKQLAGFDVASAFSDNSSDSSKNSSADNAALFEAVEMGSLLEGMLEKIKNGDWFGVGASAAEKIVSGFKSIDWNKINEKLEGVSKGFAEMINGLISFKDKDGDSLGSELAKFLCNALKTAMNTVTVFIQTLDWGKLADSLWDFIKNIDWGGLIKKFCELLGSAVGAAGSFIGTMIDNIIQAYVSYYKPFIEDAGGNILKGLLNGMLAFWKNIGPWLKENVLDPFVNSFKETFHIHSPSKEPRILELGENIIAGVFQGVLNWLSNIKEWLRQNVFEKITKAWNDMGELKLNITGNISKSFENAKSKWDSIKNKTNTATITSSIKSAFSNAKSKWDSIKNKTVTATINAKNNASSVFKNIANTLIEYINKAIDKINSKLRISISSTLAKALKAVGVNVTSGTYQVVSIPKIPKLAKGGIVNVPSRGILANIGEDGAEGVFPLQRNLEWLDILADRLTARMDNSNTPIVVHNYMMLDGKVVAKNTAKFNAQQKFIRNEVLV